MIHTLQYLWKISAGQRLRIVMSSLIGLLQIAFSLAFIWTSKLVIDIATGVTNGNLWQMGMITALLLIMQLLCNIFDSWLNSRMQVESNNALRRRIFSRVLQSKWNELDHLHTGDVVNRIEQDSTAITGLLTTALPAAWVTGIQLIASFIFFCWLDHTLPWILVGILPLFLFAGHFYMKRMQRYTREIRKSDSKIQSIIQESIQHRTVIKTLEHGDRNLEKLNDLQLDLRAQVNLRTRFSTLSKGIIAFAFSGGYLIAFLWGAVLLSQGNITFGTMTAFLQLVGKIQRPILDLARLIPAGTTAFTASERLMELESLAAEEEGEKIIFNTPPSVVFSNVTFSYPNQKQPIFNTFSTEFLPGSQIAIMGETGKGKTTLLRLLLALITPQQGEVYLTDSNHKEPVSPNTRCNFIYVPQGNSLFSGTIRDNLLMGNPEASRIQIEETLRTAVAGFVFDLPQGIDTPIGEGGSGLSEGQAQRISIARALLRPGNILLLDEATSALDSETEELLIHNLRQSSAGKTVLFITHHETLAKMCDQILHL